MESVPQRWQEDGIKFPLTFRQKQRIKILVSGFRANWRNWCRSKLTAMEDDYWANAKTGNFDMMSSLGELHGPRMDDSIDSWVCTWSPSKCSSEALPIKKDETIKQILTEADEDKVDVIRKLWPYPWGSGSISHWLYQSVISAYRTGELKNVRFAPEENAPSSSLYRKVEQIRTRSWMK